jgi:hypothetical protein
MYLYLLKRKDHPDYDEYDEKLVRANCPKHAREIANEETGDEGKIWTDSKKVSCHMVKSSGKYGVIIDSFNAG